MMRSNNPPCQPVQVPSWNIGVTIALHPRDWGFAATKHKVYGQRSYSFSLLFISFFLMENPEAIGQGLYNTGAVDNPEHSLPAFCNEKCKQDNEICLVDCCLFCSEKDCPHRCYYSKK